MGCNTVSDLDAAEPADVAMDVITITGSEFVAQTVEGMAITDDGLSQESIVTSGIFVSQSVEAPIPFNAVVPQWIQELPDTAAMALQLRTSADGRAWSDWFQVHPNIDWMEEDDPQVVGDMIFIGNASETHRFIQYMITSEGGGIDRPRLSELQFVFIDSSKGPTTESLVARQEALESLAIESGQGVTGTTEGFPKPFVISRSVWCQHSACVYTDGLKYEPVTHLIVHHTVGTNSDPSTTNYAAIVRGIWSYHTFSKTWGDIGYNYLVDPNGVIYEGHLGGDDVVGTHAAGANAGSMAVSLIGNYSDTTGIPTFPAMIDSAVDLLSWKADQRDIDVFDAGDTLPDIEWGLPNLMGHRDVYGTTECPGNHAFEQIPEMRERIAQNIGLVNTNIFVDELSPAFTNSNSNWQVPPWQCGFNLHAFYTWSTQDPAAATYWGEWRPPVPADGRYAIDAYVPYCRTGRAETAGVTYTITHRNGTDKVVVNQNARVGLWIPLGEYDLAAGNSTLVRLTDLSTTDSGLGVWFDALRLRPTTTLPAPGVSNGQPDQDTWLNQRAVTFNWQINNAATVSQTRLQVASDPGFGSLITNQAWPGAVSSAAVTFDGDYPALYWRVILDWSGGVPVTGPVARFQLDATPPESAVNRLEYVIWSSTFRVQWAGSDALSGITAYNIDFRPEGENWVRWLTNTTHTGANFIAPDPSRVYEFRSQAQDAAGNVEAVSDAADMATTQALVLRESLLLPLTLAP
jgi:hypothetical protein